MKTKVQIVNLMDHFQYNRQHKPQDIFKSIKTISVSSKDYYTFTNSHMNATQTNSFKKPDIDFYPILKNHELISLTKKTYKCSLNNPRIQSCRTKSTTPQSSFLVTNPNFHQKQRPKSRMGYELTDPVKLQKKNLLRDLIFNEPAYDHMEYDERGIFHRERDYLCFIKEKVEDFKGAKCFNKKSEVHREFNEGQVYLQCKSITIEFRNLTEKAKAPISFEVPFAYLPLFYYKDFDNMKYILLAMINFNKTYDGIKLNEDAIHHLLRTSVEYTVSTLPTQANDGSFSRHQSNVDDLENTYVQSAQLTQENAPRIQVKCNDKPFNSSFRLSNCYNLFCYLWITPVNTYQLEIKMPEITMRFPTLKKEINKTIDTELLLFLIMNNFINWDFFIVSYLLSLKAFRWVVQSTISKSFQFAYKDNDIIKQKAIVEIMKHITVKTVNGIGYYSLSRKKVKSLNEKESEFYFYQSDDRQCNHLLVLHNYQVTIFNKKMQSNKEFLFSFNLSQMRKLNAVSHWQYLPSFFNKIVTVDLMNDSIHLNYDVFEHLIPDSLKSDNRLDDNSKEINRKENMSIAIVYPYLEKIDYLRELNVQATSIISDTNESVHRVLTTEVLDEVCESDMLKWPAILSTFHGHNHAKTLTIQLKRNVMKEKSNSNSKGNANKRFTYDKSMLL